MHSSFVFVEITPINLCLWWQIKIFELYLFEFWEAASHSFEYVQDQEQQQQLSRLSTIVYPKQQETSYFIENKFTKYIQDIADKFG